MSEDYNATLLGTLASKVHQSLSPLLSLMFSSIPFYFPLATVRI